MKAAVKGENRFEGDASRYAGYLETPEGRLRTDLTFANLEEFLPASRSGSGAAKALRALDLGCGTGTAAARLARFGVHVTLLDSSAEMLKLAERTVAKAGVSAKVTIRQGDAAQLAETFPKESFNVVLCHNLLEYVDDPGAVLRGAARVMRDSQTILSVLVRSQAGEVLKAAIAGGDLPTAEKKLTAEWGEESLYGGRVRLFTPDTIEAMLKDASLTIMGRRGVRVIADYLPPQISRSAEYERILALERELGKRGEFFGAARYMQCFARRAALGAGET
jgi:S-adenosylmethionine-dependent methyltransferase